MNKVEEGAPAKVTQRKRFQGTADEYKMQELCTRSESNGTLMSHWTVLSHDTQGSGPMGGQTCLDHS